ncbi:hypothetical protein [Arcicella rosea]|uniref:Uncharacterized protein n=1 Tax=Arcicella rosea TaxID=502909 RepID=A0A841EGV0_9BACT|nr:hypothetical protein [Arcicella rosea]MBB6003417.1 hypothetical protein [Arcicella rosea]
MIRIYLDWNVISNFKKNDFKELKDFITNNKNKFIFPYSPAHFRDLMKSFSPENQYFNEDLKSLEYLSENHLMEWQTDKVKPFFFTPKAYFDRVKNKENIFPLMDIENVFGTLDKGTSEFGIVSKTIETLYKSLPIGFMINDENRDILSKMFPNLSKTSNTWDLMKSFSLFSENLLKDGKYYKDLRKSLADKGLKLESNSGNWQEEEVIKNIDNFLKASGLNKTFLEYVNLIFEQRKEAVNRYEFFTSAYLMFDMIGYKVDKLPKPTDTMQNIQIDAEHSFYAAHCDYFIASDKNLLIKSKVLYNEFNISTLALTPKEFLSHINEVIHSNSSKDYFLKEVFSFIKSDYVIESHEASSIGNEFKIFGLKLPIYYFNFFNSVILIPNDDSDTIILTFKKVFKHYSDFIYYSETERVLDDICNFFGQVETKEDFEKKKKEFIYENIGTEFMWDLGSVVIILQKDETNQRPILTYIILPSLELSPKI